MVVFGHGFFASRARRRCSRWARSTPPWPRNSPERCAPARLGWQSEARVGPEIRKALRGEFYQGDTQRSKSCRVLLNREPFLGLEGLGAWFSLGSGDSGPKAALPKVFPVAQRPVGQPFALVLPLGDLRFGHAPPLPRLHNLGTSAIYLRD